MQKSITSYFFDFIFCAVLIFFISFIWLRFYIHNNFLLYLISIIITLALSFLIYFAVKCRQNRLPKALVLDDLDALEDVNKKAKEERLAKKQAKKEVKENNKNANN